MAKGFRSTTAALVLCAAAASSQAAVTSLVDGGDTSVLFGNGALAALGLEITGVGGDTIAPGNLGHLSVAFPVNARDGALPTTFSYDSDDFLGSFAGTIEHAGSVGLTDTATGTLALTVGDFTIGFDGARAVGAASGFFVQDNIDTGAVLFDLGSPIVEAFEMSLVIAGNLLVAPELASFLGAPAAAGVDAGLALVVAKASPVPLPAAAWLLGSACLGLLFVRRRAGA